MYGKRYNLSYEYSRSRFDKNRKDYHANYSQRMYNLESNGYRNVSSLKRAFAIEVEGYDEKELLLHTIFEKSRVADTELFAIDANVVIQLLSSFEGTVVSRHRKLNRKFLKLRLKILRAG